MCAEIELGEEWIESCGDLAEALGCEVTDLVEAPPVQGDLTEEECLCGVDIMATAKKYGYRARQNWTTGCGEWVFTKRK